MKKLDVKIGDVIRWKYKDKRSGKYLYYGVSCRVTRDSAPGVKARVTILDGPGANMNVPVSLYHFEHMPKGQPIKISYRSKTGEDKTVDTVAMSLDAAILKLGDVAEIYYHII